MPPVKEPVVETPAPVASVASVHDLGQSIADAIRAGQPKQKITYDKLVKKTKFNPTGKRRKLSRRTFINGWDPGQLSTLNDEEIALLEKVTPGKFVNGLVTITETDMGLAGKQISIFWNNRDLDARMAMKTECRNFVEILKRCLDEAKGVK